MVRSEMVELIARRFPQLSIQDVDVSVREITAAIALTLVNGGRVEIRGFGSFGLNYRPPRLGRNPKTGEKVEVPAKWTPHFKAGKELRELVDAKC
jgi:integration host factor subunit beta